MSRTSWASPIARRATASALLLVLLADPGPAAARAAQRRFTFVLPAAPAVAALGAITAVTGRAVGWPQGLPPGLLPPLRGTMTAEEALRRLLRDSGYQAVRAGENAFRIVPVAATRRVARPAPPSQRPGPPPVAEVVVTGQKRVQPLREVALSLAVVDPAGAAVARALPGAREVAVWTEGLALTNLGPGRNRQFIRGVADSPFNGPSQSTVAVQLDEARVTFDAPDPDIRLVDVERVEVLKGPQGPLYGSGALGGIYQIVTRKPDLANVGGAARASAEGIAGGGIGGGAEAVLNLPLVPGRLALRGLGYAGREAGWIDNRGGGHDANVTRIAGGRLAARWRPAADWTLDLAGIVQDVNTRDSQYVTRSDDTVERTAAIAEPTDNDFRAASATLRGRLGGMDLLATSSIVGQEVDAVFDSTPASAAFGLAGTTRFNDDRKYRVVNHELRLSSGTGLRWLAGLSYLDARSRAAGTVTDGVRSVPVALLNREVRELAGFGELTLPVSHRIAATAGARLFYSLAEDEAVERERERSDRIGKPLASPSLALSWKPAGGGIVYLRYARALRPGGLAPAEGGATVLPARSGRFASDELGTFDLGFRRGDAASRLSLAAAAFLTDWHHIQSDFLLPNGLISTRNAGRGRVAGIEASGAWRPWPRVQLSAGGTYVDARLVRDDTGAKLDDRRLPVAPEVTARGSVRYRFPAWGWDAAGGVQVNYVGHARLSFDPNLDREMGGYAVVTLGLQARRERVSVALTIDNLLNERDDSFAFGNPFSIGSGRQFTPLRPRTVSLSIGRAW